jgi:hypothetical protein
MTTGAPAPDLHTLAQSLAAASLSVDAAEAFLGRGELGRVRSCLQAAAEALTVAGAWITAQRAEEADATPATPPPSEAWPPPGQ